MSEKAEEDGSAKRTRSRIACTACHKRKSKCDAAERGLPCTDCRRLGKECVLIESRRGKHARGKSAKPADPSAAVTKAAPRLVAGSSLSQGAGPSALASDITVGFTSDDISVGGLSGSGGPETPGSSNMFGFSLNLGGNALPSITMPTDSSLDSFPSILQNGSSLLASASSHVPLMLPTASTSSHIPHSVPNPFATPASESPQGVGSVSETVEGAEILVNLLRDATKNPHATHDSRQVTYLPEISSHGLMVHEFLRTKRVHFSAPFDAKSRAESTPLLSPSVTTQQMDTLRETGCFNLPSRPFMHELVKCYFQNYHASYPLIDEVDFNIRFLDGENGKVPLLLLWSVLFVGALNCDASVFGQEFPSRKEAVATFYERAKSLCDVEYGDDRIVTVQAMLLLAQNWARPTEVRADAYYWVTVAVGLAQVLGMHRNTSKSKLDPADQRLWRRIWWCCVLRDSSTAAGLGRPTHIELDYSDVELPTLADFEDIPDGIPYDVLVYKSATNAKERLDQALYFIESAKLTLLGYEVLKLQFKLAMKDSSPAVLLRQESSIRNLNNWAQNLPSQMRLGSSDESNWTAYLHLQLNMWLLYLHRQDSSEEKQRLASKAAVAITRLFEDILDKGVIRQVPGFGITCLFAALAQHSADRRHSLISDSAPMAQHRIAMCMLAAKALSQTRPTAGWFLTLFNWLEEAQTQIIRSRRGSPKPSAGAVATLFGGEGSGDGSADGNMEDMPLPEFSWPIDWASDSSLLDFLVDPSSVATPSFNFDSLLVDGMN